jgi:hypothetical protein
LSGKNNFQKIFNSTTLKGGADLWQRRKKPRRAAKRRPPRRRKLLRERNAASRLK